MGIEVIGIVLLRVQPIFRLIFRHSTSNTTTTITASTALGVEDEMELVIIPMQIGERIANVGAMVADSWDSLSGFEDGHQAH